MSAALKTLESMRTTTRNRLGAKRLALAELHTRVTEAETRVAADEALLAEYVQAIGLLRLAQSVTDNALGGDA